MTNKTITDMTAASALDGSELIPITQGGNSRKLPLAKFATVDAMVTSSIAYSGGDIDYAEGDIIEAGGFRYEVAASGASDEHLTTAGGVKLYVLPNGTGEVSAAQLGVVPDGVTNWEADYGSRMTALYDLSATDGIIVVWPGGEYATSMNIGSDHDGCTMRFENAVFLGILHLIDGIDAVRWSGEVSSYDRLGLNGCTNSVLPEKIHMLSDPAKNTAQPGIGNRGVHFLASEGIEWGEIIVHDTAPTQAALPGAQTIWAGVAIQSHALSGFKGRIHVKNASGHGIHVNALDVDLDIQVDGYGKSAIQYATGTFLQNTDSQAQSEQGCGIWLNRCTGRVRLKVDQSNASPAADVYSILIDETGTSSVTSSRNETLVVESLVASVGNGSRGVCVGEDLSPSPVCNVFMPQGAAITMRSADTLETGFAGFNVVRPSTVNQSYRVLNSTLPIVFSDFTTQTGVKVTSATGTYVYTEVNIKSVKAITYGAGTLIDIDGTGGELRGEIGRIDARITSGSSSAPVVSVDSTDGFSVLSGSLIPNGPVSTCAVKLSGASNGTFGIERIENFGRFTDGGYLIEDLSQCTIRDTFMSRDNITGEGFRFSGTLTDCTFSGLKVDGLSNGFTKTGTPTFTRCVATRCTAINNTTDTTLTLAEFPAANQLGCTNFAV
jgi:hypothetical protein